MLQASCLAIAHGYPFIELASENKKRVEQIKKLQDQIERGKKSGVDLKTQLANHQQLVKGKAPG
jgi:hypothetical protein